MTAALLLGAALFLGAAVHARNGAFSTVAIIALTVSFGLAVASFFHRRTTAFEQRGDARLRVAAGVGAACQFAMLLSHPIAIYLQNVSPESLFTMRLLLVVAAAVTALVIAGPAPARRASTPLLVVPHLLLGLWVIRHSPLPHIDVYYFQRDSVEALLRGHNPYTLTFPNIYGEGTKFYGPNLSVGGRLQFGFPYPPLNLLLALPGHLLGDFRYSQLVSMEAAALLLAYAGAGETGPLGAAILLYTPRSFFIIEQGWTEPFVVLLLSAVLFCARRWPRSLPVVAGAFLAVKQYLLFAIVPMALLLGRPFRVRTFARLLVPAMVTVAALTLPLALWDFRAFAWDTLELQLHQPFRNDALSYLALIARLTGVVLPGGLAVAPAIAATVFGLRRAAPTPAGFAGTTALVFFAFLAFNKQAFCNYYYFVIGALCAAVSATHAETAPLP